MRDSIRRSLARGSLIAVTLVVTGVFSGTALSSSATRSSEGETVISAVEQQRFVATKLELTTVPQIKRYLRSLGVNPMGVVVQRGPMNYAGPNCPGPAWNCTTATRVIQLSASAAAAAANRFICRRDNGAGTADPANTPPEQSCVIVQPGGASNFATCDMDTSGAAGLISQTCLITQGGASNTAVAKLMATLTGPGTEQDIRQRIEIKQTGGTSGNTLRATQNARLRMNFGSGGALAAKQDFNQVICANQQAAGSGSNTATVTQKGDSLAQARNRGDVSVLQNTEERASMCLPTGPAAPFADFSGTGHDPTLCPVLGDVSDDPKEDANICARVQQDSVSGRNRITQDQHALVNAVIDRSGKVDLRQGSADGGVDSTQDQRSTNLSTIADTQNAEQLTSVAQVTGPINITQVEDPRCCAAGHQLSNTGNTWKLRQNLRQRTFVNKVLVNPETFEGGEIEQTGSNIGNCTTSGIPPAGCTVEQELTNNVETETNSCGPASSCDVIIECSAASSSSSCTTEEDEDVTLSNTATVSSTTPDPNLENNSDTEPTVVSGSAPDALLSSLSLRSFGPRAVTPAAQDPTPSASIQAAVPPDVIIDNGSLVQLGLHLEGHLNVCCGSASSEIGETAVGLRYLPTDGEGTAPGCDCEGWGIANADEATGTFTGHANADDGIVNLTVDPTSGPYGPDESVDPDSTGTRFRAITTTSDRIKVTQDYHPSSTPNLYEVVVTMENIGATPIGDVRYRRVMDWDIPPTTFWEWSEIHVGTSTALVRATSDGFLTANPLDMTPPGAGVPPTTLQSGDPDYFSGPDDQGSSFDFTFGSLQPGQTKSFRIFYGAAGTQALAKAAIAAVGGEIYSLGMPSTSFDEGAPAATEGPNVFVFAFAGVGGEPVGDISLAPLTAENQVGEDHTVTATLDDEGAPISGKVVTFTVVSGPNAGVTGTDTSDANGEATFTYTSSLTGTDQIEAKFVDDNENIQTSNRVEKTWVAAPASADLSVDKSDSPDPVAEGEELTYTIAISNNGPDAAQAVTLTDVLPESVTFNSAEASQGTCTGTTTVTCNLGTIANGASATVTITVTP